VYVDCAFFGDELHHVCYVILCMLTIMYEDQYDFFQVFYLTLFPFLYLDSVFACVCVCGLVVILYHNVCVCVLVVILYHNVCFGNVFHRYRQVVYQRMLLQAGIIYKLIYNGYLFSTI
jgi:hypothetical protein